MPSPAGKLNQLLNFPFSIVGLQLHCLFTLKSTLNWGHTPRLISTAHRACTQPLRAGEPLISPHWHDAPLTGFGIAKTILVATPPTPTLGPIPALTFVDPPLPHATPAVVTSLILSPSLPPIPAKLVVKGQAGSFLTMKQFLADNIALTQ